MDVQQFNARPLPDSYLDGTSFDESVTFEYEFATPLRSRFDLLSELVAGKSVLHIGCCDHIPLLAEKIAARAWLHGRLTETARFCLGVDIDPRAVAESRRISGLDNIVLGDVTAAARLPEIAGHRFDYAILGEVVEHIGNPVSFLARLLGNYRDNIAQVVITVPNALRGSNIKNIFKGRENINSDHRFFFTPYTIAKVAWDAGLAPVSMQMAHYTEKTFIKRTLFNRFPLLADDLVYIGAPRG